MNDLFNVESGSVEEVRVIDSRGQKKESKKQKFRKMQKQRRNAISPPHNEENAYQRWRLQPLTEVCGPSDMVHMEVGRFINSEPEYDAPIVLGNVVKTEYPNHYDLECSLFTNVDAGAVVPVMHQIETYEKFGHVCYNCKFVLNKNQGLGGKRCMGDCDDWPSFKNAWNDILEKNGAVDIEAKWLELRSKLPFPRVVKPLDITESLYFSVMCEYFDNNISPNCYVYMCNNLSMFKKFINYVKQVWHTKSSYYRGVPCAEILAESVISSLAGAAMAEQIKGMDRQQPHDEPAIEPSDNHNKSTINQAIDAWSVGLKHDDAPADQSKTVCGMEPFNGNIHEIIRTPGRVGTVEWKTSDPKGKILARIPMFPGISGRKKNDIKAYDPHKIWNNQEEVNDVSFYDCTPVAFVSQWYQYYKMDLAVTIEMLPSSYHMGQLLACYVPGESPTDVDINTLGNVSPMIMDTSEKKNKQTFTVPYVNYTDYINFRTDFQSYDKGTTDLTVEKYNIGTGNVYLVVLNPLRIGTVGISTSIDINVYLAGENATFMGPGNQFRYFFRQNSGEVYYPSWVCTKSTITPKPPPDLGGCRCMGDDNDVTSEVPGPNMELPGQLDAPRRACFSAAKAPTISTDNIFERRYFYETQFDIKTTDARDKVLLNVQLPQAFINSKYATSIVKYYEFFRANFEVTLVLPPTKFHCGAMVAYMSVDAGQETNQSVMRAPHCFANFKEQTRAEFTIPYNFTTRLMRMQATTPFCFVRVKVWNQLRTGSTGSTTLQGTVYLSLKNANISVPTVLGERTGEIRGIHCIEEEGETDTGKGSETTKLTPIVGGQTPERKYRVGSHNNMYELLKVPAPIAFARTEFRNNDAGIPMQICKIPVRLNPRQRMMTESFRMWSGSINIDFDVVIGMVPNLKFFAYWSPSYYLDVQAGFPLDFTGEETPISKQYDGYNTLTISPTSKNSFRIRIPYYSAYPAKYTGYSNGTKDWYVQNLQTALGTIWLAALSSDWDTEKVDKKHTLGMWFWSSIGEDYRLYMPKSLPWVYIRDAQVAPGKETNAEKTKRYLPPIWSKESTCGTIAEGGWLRDLTTEGIEPNPGPVMSKFYGADHQIFNAGQDHHPASDEYFVAMLAQKALPSDSMIGRRCMDGDMLDDLGEQVSYVPGFWIKTFSIIIGMGVPTVIGLITGRLDPMALWYKLKQKTLTWRDKISNYLMNNSSQKVIDYIKSILLTLKSLLSVAWIAWKIAIFISPQNEVYTAVQLAADFMMLHANLDKIYDIVGKLVKHFRKQKIDDLTVQQATSVLSGARCISKDPRIEAGTGLLGSLFSYMASLLYSNTSLPYRLPFFVADTFASSLVKFSVSSFLKTLSGGIEMLINFFFYGSETPADIRDRKVFESNKDRITELMGEYMYRFTSGLFNHLAINDLVTGGNDKFNQLSSMKFLELCNRECMKYQQILPWLQINHVDVSKWIGEVINLTKKIMTSKAYNVSRVEPLGIGFKGGPGLGKSLLLSKLLPKSVLTELQFMRVEDQVEELVYSAPSDPNSKYYDNYTGQPWFLYDDFGTDAEGHGFREIIQMISPSSYILNMASLDDKGMQLVSPFIVISTNLDSLKNTNAITNPEAITRRFQDNYYEIKLREGMDNDGKLDFMGLTQRMAGIQNNELLMRELDRTWEFVPVDPLNSTQVGSVTYTYSEVVKKIVRIYKLKTAGSKEVDSVMQFLGKRTIEEVDLGAQDYSSTQFSCWKDEDTCWFQERKKKITVEELGSIAAYLNNPYLMKVFPRKSSGCDDSALKSDFWCAILAFAFARFEVVGLERLDSYLKRDVARMICNWFLQENFGKQWFENKLSLALVRLAVLGACVGYNSHGLVEAKLKHLFGSWNEKTSLRGWDVPNVLIETARCEMMRLDLLPRDMLRWISGTTIADMIQVCRSDAVSDDQLAQLMLQYNHRSDVTRMVNVMLCYLSRFTRQDMLQVDKYRYAKAKATEYEEKFNVKLDAYKDPNFSVGKMLPLLSHITSQDDEYAGCAKWACIEILKMLLFTGYKDMTLSDCRISLFLNMITFKVPTWCPGSELKIGEIANFSRNEIRYPLPDQLAYELRGFWEDKHCIYNRKGYLSCIVNATVSILSAVSAIGLAYTYGKSIVEAMYNFIMIWMVKWIKDRIYGVEKEENPEDEEDFDLPVNGEQCTSYAGSTFKRAAKKGKVILKGVRTVDRINAMAGRVRRIQKLWTKNGFRGNRTVTEDEIKRFENNCLPMYVEGVDGKRFCGRVLFLDTNHFVMNLHAYKMLVDINLGAKLYIGERGANKEVINYRNVGVRHQFINLPSTDGRLVDAVVGITLRAWQNVHDIKKNFMTMKEWNYWQPLYCSIMAHLFVKGSMELRLREKGVTSTDKVFDKTCAGYMPVGARRKIGSSIVAGDSGSLVTMLSTQCIKVMGIVVGHTEHPGVPLVGNVLVITQEQIAGAIEILDQGKEPIPTILSKTNIDDVIEREDPPGDWVDNTFEYMGKIRNLEIHQPQKNDIVKSFLHDQELFPDGTLPVRLNKKNLIARSKKFGYEGKEWDSFHKDGWDWVEALHKIDVDMCPDFHDMEPLTWFEVLNGRDGLEPIDLDKSTGYWNVTGATRKSLFKKIEVEEGKWLIEFSEDAHTFCHPITGRTFMEHLEDCEEKLQRGERPDWFWVSTLKAERKKAEKIDRPRVFEIPGIECFLLQRKYWGRFVIYHQLNGGFQLNHGIGIDAAACGDLYYRMLNNGGQFKNGFGFDYECFDGSERSEHYVMWGRTMDYFHKGEESREQMKNARWTLIDDMINSYHILGDHIAKSSKALESGAVPTASGNSYVGKTNLAYSFWELYVEKFGREPAFQTFRNSIRFLVYGDDNIVTASDKTLEWFNALTIAKCLKRYGWVITSTDKTGDPLPQQPLNELTFLKREFILNKRTGRMSFALPPETIYGMINWIDKKHLRDVGIRIQILDQAFEAASWRGEKFYNELVLKLLKVIHKDQELEAVDWCPPNFYKLRAQNNMKMMEAECLKDLISFWYPSGKTERQLYDQIVYMCQSGRCRKCKNTEEIYRMGVCAQCVASYTYDTYEKAYGTKKIVYDGKRCMGNEMLPPLVDIEDSDIEDNVDDDNRMSHKEVLDYCCDRVVPMMTQKSPIRWCWRHINPGYSDNWIDREDLRCMECERICVTLYPDGPGIWKCFGCLGYVMPVWYFHCNVCKCNVNCWAFGEEHLQELQDGFENYWEWTVYDNRKYQELGQAFNAIAMADVECSKMDEKVAGQDQYQGSVAYECDILRRNLPKMYKEWERNQELEKHPIFGRKKDKLEEKALKEWKESQEMDLDLWKLTLGAMTTQDKFEKK